MYSVKRKTATRDAESLFEAQMHFRRQQSDDQTQGIIVVVGLLGKMSKICGIVRIKLEVECRTRAPRPEDATR